MALLTFWFDFLPKSDFEDHYPKRRGSEVPEIMILLICEAALDVPEIMILLICETVLDLQLKTEASLRWHC